MTIDVRGACRDVFRALSIERADTLRVRGQSVRCPPDALVAALQVAVYTHFHCDMVPTAPRMDRHQLLERLYAAYPHSSPGTLTSTAGAGSYVARGLVPSPRARWLRLYWNVDHCGAVVLMQRAPALLDRQGVPFRLKVLLDVSVRRRDMAVLYVARDRWPFARRVVKDVYDAVAAAGRLQPATPLFTKPLRSGLGLAEDPDTGASFGMYRAAIVARAMAKCYLRARTGEHDQWMGLREEFALQGLSLDVPYLNPGALEVYDF